MGSSPKGIKAFLATIGGEPIDDIYGYSPEITWYRLVSKFLQTGIKHEDLI